MMISAKIKIAAILMVIAAIPVGAGALLLADRPEPAPQSVAPPSAVAAASAVADASPEP